MTRTLLTGFLLTSLHYHVSNLATMSMTSKNLAKPMGNFTDSQDTGNYTQESFKVILKKLVQTPTEFTPNDCASAFRHLCAQAASDAQVS